MTAYAELGSVLKAAREKAGRSVADLAGDTGLPERYVQALESGDMTVLPDLAYARLYCQSYARALNLDVDEFMKAWPGARKAEPLPAPVSPQSRSGSWRWPVLALAAAVGIWILVQAASRDDSHFDQRPAEVLTSPPVPTPDFALTNDSVSFEVSGTANPPARFPTGDSVSLEVTASATPPAQDLTSDPVFLQSPSPVHSQALDPTSDSVALEVIGTSTPPVREVPTRSDHSEQLLTLQVTAGEQSWVVIEADGDTVEARVLVKDQSLRAQAQAEFRLTATNSRGLRVLLDGEKVLLDARKDRPLIRHRITGKGSP